MARKPVPLKTERDRSPPNCNATVQRHHQSQGIRQATYNAPAIRRYFFTSTSQSQLCHGAVWRDLGTTGRLAPSFFFRRTLNKAAEKDRQHDTFPFISFSSLVSFFFLRSPILWIACANPRQPIYLVVYLRLLRFAGWTPTELSIAKKEQ